MSVIVSVWLFGKPAWELGEGDGVTPEELRELAGELGDRLRATADIVEELARAGWQSHVGLYDLEFTHPEMDFKASVEAQFRALGIDLRRLSIAEVEDEEEVFVADDDEGE
jgi:hypothetical protein